MVPHDLGRTADMTIREIAKLVGKPPTTITRLVAA
jgi:DNA-binding MurR/RpiR family transcriptional regulator